MSAESIPFNRPYMTGRELQNIAESHANGRLAGDGPFTDACHKWMEQRTGSARALLTHSCTAALEMTALLLDIAPGDEVIMPSFTFVSTANAFVLRGALPVFVDVRDDTLNLDASLLEAAITSRTRVIVPVHYAGVACEMDRIIAIARRHGLRVVEDAAQGMMASYKGRALGTMGDLAALSFHETKNITSGEGGCLLVNDPALVSRAEIIREKGTDRSRFFRGAVDKYTWQEVGSSFLPGELTAAFLWAQLEKADWVTAQRLATWRRYHDLLAPLERNGLLRRPVVPAGCQHNAHMYYVRLPAGVSRSAVLEELKEDGIGAVFHYVPLHSSPGGLKYCRTQGDLAVTNAAWLELIRLPLWIGLTEAQQARVVAVLERSLASAV